MHDLESSVGDAVLELFSSGLASSAPLPVLPRVDTPLGAVRFTLAIGELPVDGAGATAAYRLPHDALLVAWDMADARVELLLARPHTTFPADPSLLDRFAAMWRVRARRDLPPCTFGCELERPPAAHAVGPSPGECLEANVWADGQLTLALGMEDALTLAARAHAGAGLPTRLAPLVEEAVWPYTESGLRRRLPALLAGELVQLHFVVAWAHESEDGVESWLAVDLPPGAVLAGAECA